MGAFRLTFALIRIPRLFASLLLFPLILGLVLVYFQLLLTGVFVKVINRHSAEVAAGFKHNKEENYIRKVIYGDGKPLPQITVCRWQEKTDEQGNKFEAPPLNPECYVDRLDVALQVDNPATYPVEEHVQILNGNVPHLHVCRTCKPHPDIVIREVNGERRAEIYSLVALILSSLTLSDDSLSEQYLETMRRGEHVISLLGKRYLHSSGFRAPIQLYGLQTFLALTANLAFLIIVALWLALKAHRKVLDYFARNGALLPMVAATGKQAFYNALWLLTALRVSFFLLGAVPLTIIWFIEMVKEEHPSNSEAET